MAPVVKALKKCESVETRLALTGQHTDLLDQALQAFSLDPAYDLGIMREGQTLYDVAQGCLDGLREVVQGYRPDMMLVQGDTATVFFGSLVAFFEKIPVGHVEAGLRSRNKWAPFPEEVFRRLTDVISDFHFAPTGSAAESLLNEGVRPEQVHVTGNTVVDALLQIAAVERAPDDPTLTSILADTNARLVLLTAHRRESFGQPIRDVFAAVRKIADEHADVRVLYPVHPNPNVVEPAAELLGEHPRVHLVEPLAYLDLVAALRHAHLILTDSGGIQEEAPTFGTPVLVLREVTERPEGIETGAARLVGTDRERIVAEATKILAHAARGFQDGPESAGTGTNTETAEENVNPYGDGRAGERIADIVVSTLTGVSRSTTDWEGP